MRWRIPLAVALFVFAGCADVPNEPTLAQDDVLVLKWERVAGFVPNFKASTDDYLYTCGGSPPLTVLQRPANDGGIETRWQNIEVNLWLYRWEKPTYEHRETLEGTGRILGERFDYASTWREHYVIRGRVTDDDVEKKLYCELSYDNTGSPHTMYRLIILGDECAAGSDAVCP